MQDIVCVVGGVGVATNCLSMGAKHPTPSLGVGSPSLAVAETV